MQIQKIGVIGAGTMGNGIAHVFAGSGFSVILCDVEQRFLERGIATITKNLDREVAKNKITDADKVSALKNIEPVTDRSKLAGCDFIVEAATEKFEIKTEIFRDLDRLVRPEVILASNTSSISITKLAALTKRPEKVIGMHFFHHRHGIKEVHPNHFLGTLGQRSKFRDRYRRSIRSQNHFRPYQPIEVAKNLRLDFELLGRSLNDEIAAGQLGSIRYGLNVFQRRHLVRVRDLVLRHLAIKILG